MNDPTVWLILLLALVSVWSLVVSQRLRRELRLRNQALIDLVEGLRLTVEYVGTDVLPPIPGWAWYDALSRWSPDAVALIGNRPAEHSNLITHAQRELEIIGEEDSTVQGYLRVIRAFADMGHSGGSAMVAIPVINQLLLYQNLTPLTDDPGEWQYHGEELWGDKNGVWQNRRNSEAFSNDGGVTYYLLSERGNKLEDFPVHVSMPIESGERHVF